MPGSDILLYLGASAPDLFNLVMGLLFALFVLGWQKSKSANDKAREERYTNRAELRDKLHREDLQRLRTEYREDINKTWEECRVLREENKILTNRYHQVDKQGFGNGLVLKKVTGIDTMSQSADGDGDHTLNRDIELP